MHYLKNHHFSRVRLATCLFALINFAAACGSIDFFPNPNPCEGVADAHACRGLEVVSCKNGQVISRVDVCDSEAYCDPEIGAQCSCIVGRSRCKDKRLQICSNGIGTANEFTDAPEQCKSHEVCRNGDEKCTPLQDKCEAQDQKRCKDDGNTIQVCKKMDPYFELDWDTLTTCKENGFANGCKFDGVVSPDQPTELCENICGGRTPLYHDICDNVPQDAGTSTCGWLICSPDKTSLISDHKECRGNSVKCMNDQECASCKCTNQQCQSSDPSPCPAPATFPQCENKRRN